MKRALSAIFLICGVASTAPSAQDAIADRLTREIVRISETAERVVPEDQRAPARQRLARAKASVEAGRLHLALYDIEGAFVMTEAFVAVREAAAVKTSEEFVAKWKATGEPRPRATTAASAPALWQALAGSAAARAPVTYRASLPYSQDDSVASGLYYLGEARALAGFAEFVRSLSWTRTGSPASLRSIAPELDTFEREVTSAYTRMAPADHPTYIITSVLLKRARVLDDAGEHAGALLEYLLARLRFAPLRGAVTVAAADERGIADARARLTGGTDHSIAQLFVEMAQAGIASEDAALRRNAATILADILPAYHAATGRAMTTAATHADPAVTITLVRWPFT